ncbi:MAG: cyanophycinase [Bacteroidales bacterium]
MRYTIFLLLIFLQPLSTSAQEKIARGPEKGTLLLMGGHAKDSIFFPVFSQLIGGKDVPIVIIPTAKREEAIHHFNFLERQKQRFEDAGFNDVTILHTRSRKKADSEAFVEPLRRAEGVWIMGGLPWRLADAYLNTLTHKELNVLLERGGVIAGTSAGASIQASFLVRGDTVTNTVIEGPYKEGFGFLKNTAIDQHLLDRNRQFDMFRILEKRPGLFGLGLDENTGIIVKNDTLEVIGESYVAVYDGQRWSAEKDTVFQLAEDEKEFYFLQKKDRYFLPEKKIIKGNRLRYIFSP